MTGDYYLELLAVVEEMLIAEFIGLAVLLVVAQCETW